MNLLRHRFTSGKVDGADPTQVQPSAWNDGHLFTGGSAGDILVRDPNDAAYGAGWTSGSYNNTITTGGVAYLPIERMDHLVILNSPTNADLYGAPPVSGTFKVGARLDIINIGIGAYRLLPQQSSVAVGRFYNFMGSVTATYLAGAACAAARYVWDGAIWRMVAHEQGAPVILNLAPGNLVGFTASSIQNQDFYVRGREVHLRIYFTPASIPSSVASLELVGLPFMFVPSPTQISVANYTPTHASWGTNWVGAKGDGSGLAISTKDFSPWPATDIYLSIDATFAVT